MRAERGADTLERPKGTRGTKRTRSRSTCPHGVHGGLNFATFCQDTGDESQGICHIPGPGEPDHVYWLGFDCGHIGDKKPGNDALLRKVAPDLEEMRQALSVGILAETYRDLAYVQDQCRHLAHQVQEAGTR